MSRSTQNDVVARARKGPRRGCGRWLILSGAFFVGCGVDDRQVAAAVGADPAGANDANRGPGGSAGGPGSAGGAAGATLDVPGSSGSGGSAGGAAGGLGAEDAGAGRGGEAGNDADSSAGGGELPVACVTRPASFRVLDALSTNTASAVSADGRFVVGESETTSGGRAFRWSVETGIQNLGTLPDHTDSGATALSADGSVVVGYSSGPGGERAFRWSESTGMQDLGVVAPSATSHARAVSSDGSVVVGSSGSAPGGSAFRWTGLTGMRALGLGLAAGANADGSLVVGYGLGVRAPDSEDAFRWTSSGGIQDLGASVGQGGTWPSTVSSDGRVIVGYRLDANANYRAFRWLESEGAVDIPVLASDTPSVADSYGYATNADGSVVVGTDDNGTSSSFVEAFVWTAASGTQRVAELLPTTSVPAGWLLRSASGVSADGLTIVGEGRETLLGPAHAWVATLARNCP